MRSVILAESKNANHSQASAKSWKFDGDDMAILTYFEPCGMWDFVLFRGAVP